MSDFEVDLRWLDDCRLGFVRGFREYCRDRAVIAKVEALFARIAALEAEVERLRGLLAEALPELDEHDAEYKHATKSGLKERMREACAQSGEGER